jgi:2-dehydro-3-deoxyphosphogluconate aldolase / (4S)-4-hydroxy-2-oxoglutarate aldolase
MTDWVATLRSVRALPVIVIDDLADAVPLCSALVQGGLRMLEITLRTPAGLDAIAQVSALVPGAIVGAGTVTNPAEYRAAIMAGATFVVTPGQTPELLAAAAGNAVPLVPGCGSASDVMAIRQHGFRIAKIFPAELLGGAAMVKALMGPFPDQYFVPSGGVTAEKAKDYRAISSVLTVSGSWMMPADAIKAKDWNRVRALAEAA